MTASCSGHEQVPCPAEHPRRGGRRDSRESLQGLGGFVVLIYWLLKVKMKGRAGQRRIISLSASKGSWWGRAERQQLRARFSNLRLLLPTASTETSAPQAGLVCTKRRAVPRQMLRCATPWWLGKLQRTWHGPGVRCVRHRYVWRCAARLWMLFSITPSPVAVP